MCENRALLVVGNYIAQMLRCMHATCQQHDTGMCTSKPICMVQTSNDATQRSNATKAFGQDTCQRNEEGVCTCGRETKRQTPAAVQLHATWTYCGWPYVL